MMDMPHMPQMAGNKMVPMNQRMEQVNIALEKLENQISSLEIRLGPVSNRTPEINAKDMGTAVASMSPLVMQMNKFIEKIEKCNTWLSKLERELEI